MNYFSSNYSKINYPIASTSIPGLRNAQIGAISAINSHFTIHEKEPAIIVMPTGSGKTTVLFLSAFTQRAQRVLIVTPSKLVRNQIAEGIGTLDILKNNGIIEATVSLPKVNELKTVVTDSQAWNSLKAFDVVVTTPNAIVPDSENFNPPDDLFDLVLIDEAHHSPAHTWDLILRGFKKAKKILFTATPFRRDQKEIKGRIIFNYPITKAFEDKIFGEVEYLPVELNNDISDIAIAKKANQEFQKDKNDGYEHYLMVRTDTKKHAKELVKLYQENTGLKLKRIDSTMSSRSISNAITQLKNKELDGVICVDMLGEGFDFPNLKIAAIHRPHKSLAITLQFIGRFARTNNPNIGNAKFIAVPNEVEFYKIQLYREGAVWKSIIKDLSETAIDEEVEIRETFSKFENKDIELEDDVDISLYSLKPYHHVKIYEANSQVDITKTIEIPGNLIEKYMVSDELSTIVLITKEITKPKWLINDDLVDTNYNLFIIYYCNPPLIRTIIY